MRVLSRIECFNNCCTNEASVTINGDHVCTQCARTELPTDMHKFLPAGDRCPVHNTTYGEGDFCHMCEAVVHEI